MTLNNDVRLVALSLPAFNCGGDFSKLRAQVQASNVPEFDAVMRQGVAQFRRNGMLREPDVLAIESVLNARLTEMVKAESAAIDAAAKDERQGRVERWMTQQLLDTDDLR